MPRSSSSERTVPPAVLRVARRTVPAAILHVAVSVCPSFTKRLSVCSGQVQPAVLPAVLRVPAVPLLCQSVRHSLSVCLCAQAKFKREFRQLFSMLLCESVRHSLSICLCAQGKFNQQFCQLFSVLPCCRVAGRTVPPAVLCVDVSF